MAVAQAVQSGVLKAGEVVAHYAERMDQGAQKLGCMLHWDRAAAEVQAEAVQKRVARGERLPLAGVPVVVKDNLSTRGMPTTCGSRILEGFVPPYDAHVVERLKAAGAVVFGKANMDEFAMGSSTEHSAYGPAKNPWDLTRVPGGSSGGSAAAVAADLCPVALGSDTGGSVRQPASFCGLVGLKPTYGRVSRYGLVAYGSSLDQVGPLTRTVDDAALLFDAIQGFDARDSTSRLVEGAEASMVGVLAKSDETAKKPRLGLVKELMGEGLGAETRAVLDQAVAKLKGLGFAVETVSLPSLAFAIPTYYVIAMAEASSNLSRFDGVRYGLRVDEKGQSLGAMYQKSRAKGFGAEVKRRIMLGTFALSSGYYDAYYARAQSVRQLLRQDLARVFNQVDVLVSPVAPEPAFKFGEKSQDPIAMYLGDICTIGANLAGIPALALPAGFTTGPVPLPVGMQLMAPHDQEARLFRCARAFETATRSDFVGKRPAGAPPA